MLQRIAQRIESFLTRTPVRAAQSAVQSTGQALVRKLEHDALKLSTQVQQRIAQGSAQAAGAAVEGTVVGLRREGAAITKAAGHAAPLPDLHALIPDSVTSPAQFTRGGFKKLMPNHRVQGSDIVGGTQPSFLIERDSKPMRELLEHARQVGSDKKLTLWQKIEAIQERTRKSIRYPASGAQQEALQALNRQHLLGAAGIGEYHKIGFADCRGFAVTTQVLLQEAKIDSFFSYARTFYQGAPGVDHAFNVVRENGKLFVVDTLNQAFNKVPLTTMLSQGAQGYRFELHQALPFVYRNPIENVAAALR